MKIKQYALLAALIYFSAAAVDSATFDTIIELYKKQQATRKDVINAYGQLEDKQIGDQLLSAFLKTTISTLQSEEARKAPEIDAAPAAVNHGRPECADRGCGAKRPLRNPQSPHKRQRRKNIQSPQDVEEAKRRSLETALKERDKENLEAAKAISLVDTAEDQSLERAKAVSTREALEENDLQVALKKSISAPSTTATKKPMKSDQALIHEAWTNPCTPKKNENKQPQELALKPLSSEDREFVNKAWNTHKKNLPTAQPVSVVEQPIKPEYELVSEEIPEKPRNLPGIEVSLCKDGTAKFETSIDQYSTKNEETFFWAVQKKSKPTLELWSYQLSQKTKTDDARWQALTPVLKSYNKPGAPREGLALIMRDTLKALDNKSCAQYHALPQQLR